MNYYKKTAAFVLGLLTAFSLSFSSYVPGISLISAEEGDIVVIDNDGNVIKEEVSNEIQESGNIKYYNQEDGTVLIASCSSEDETLTLPSEIDGKKVSGISGGAFQYLNSRKIIIPADVTYDISENPFAACILLEEFEVDAANSVFSSKDGILFSKDGKILYSYPAAKKGSSYDIPEETEELGTAAFYNTKFEKVSIPSGLKTLGRHCFGLTALKSIDLSGTEIEIIPPMTFVRASSLTEVILPETVYDIQVGAFMNCSALEEISLPEYLETVGQAAFQGAGLKEIFIPESVDSIGYNAFGYYDENNAVEDFTVIAVPGSVGQTYCTDYDGDYQYQNTFTFMPVADYNRKLQLESMDIQKAGTCDYAVKEDGTALLVDSSSDSSKLEIPATVNGHDITSIYYGALKNCSATEIIIPNTVTVIGEDVFPAGTEKITLSGNLQEIEGKDPFIKLTSLKEISVGEGDGAFSAENGILYNKDKTTVIAYPQAKDDKTVKLPSSVKEIADSAFSYNNHLMEADISSAEAIGDYAFEGCQSLSSVKLSRKLKTIGTNAFLGCTSLSGIRVYDKVESISEYAFGYTYDAALAADIEKNPENYVNEDGTVNNMPYSLYSDFKMYVKKDSLAYQYAEDCGIETDTDSVTIGKTNVDMKLFYILGGCAGAGVLAALIKLIAGKAKKKKKK